MSERKTVEQMRHAAATTVGDDLAYHLGRMQWFLAEWADLMGPFSGDFDGVRRVLLSLDHELDQARTNLAEEAPAPCGALQWAED